MTVRLKLLLRNFASVITVIVFAPVIPAGTVNVIAVSFHAVMVAVTPSIVTRPCAAPKDVPVVVTLFPA